MNIGISAQLLKEHPTGVEIYVFNLLKHLLQADGDNRYFIYCYDNSLTRELGAFPKAVIRPIGLPRSKLLRVFFEQVQLPGMLLRDKVDVYHSPAYIIPRLLPARMPAVVSVFDIFAISKPEFCRFHNNIYYHIALPHSVRRANRILTLSQVVKDEIISTFRVPSANITVNYPGIGTPRDGNSEVDGRYILHIGNFDPKKNMPFLLKAFETLKLRDRIPHKLILAGELAWQYQSARKMAQASPVASDIVFTGYVSEQRKWGLLRNADLFVFPSLFEGFGFPPLEAAIARTPVLVSDIPIFRETVPGAAFFQPGDLDSCVEQMRNLLVRRSQQSIGLGRFSYQQHANTCIGIYRELSGQHSG